MASAAKAPATVTVLLLIVASRLPLPAEAMASMPRLFWMFEMVLPATATRIAEAPCAEMRSPGPIDELALSMVLLLIVPAMAVPAVAAEPDETLAPDAELADALPVIVLLETSKVRPPVELWLRAT